MPTMAKTWNRKMVFFGATIIQLQGRKSISTEIITSALRSRQWQSIENTSSLGIFEDVKRLCKQGRLHEALDVLHLIDQRGIRVDSYAYASLLQGCANMKALPEGKLVHTHMIETGLKPDIILGNKLVIMYANCGGLVHALRVLDEMPARDVVSWTAVIAAYSRRGIGEEALMLFNKMQRTGIQPNQFTFTSVLPACGNLAALEHGKEAHEDIIRRGFHSDVFVGNALVGMYAKCGNIGNARLMFDKMPERDVVSWNAIIAGYAQNGHVDEALKLFQKMPERNVVSWTAIVTGCAHNGHFEDALKLFQKMPERSVVSWNAVIAAYVRRGYGEEALALFYEMQRSCTQPNQYTFTSVLLACADLAALEHGKELHQHIKRSGFQSNIYIGNALVNMYCKCGSLDDAYDVFDKMLERDVVSWNTMIAGYAQNGLVDEALKLFQEMPEPNVVTWTTMVAGYANKGNFEEALNLFHKMPERDVVSWNVMIAGYAHIGHVNEALNLFQKMPERDVVSWTAMIAGYAQNGNFDEALKLFQKMPVRNVISWNAMIGGYAQNGYVEEALKLFQQMQLTGVKPDSATFANVLLACSDLAALQEGKQVHEVIIRSGFQCHIFVSSALVGMYAKCGSIDDAYKVFDKIPRRDVVSWTAMIVGYAMHGCGMEALQLFEQMQLFGIKPNHVTFVGVLSACCHAGLVDDAWHYFECMSRDYHITPAVEHYCCMVDLLGRAGRLDEAQDFINKMPIEPDAAVWGSLLAACRIHTNIELGEHVAERLLGADPENAAHYVILSNIYAAAGRWGDIEKVRKIMKDRKVKKMPGCSWIEVNNKVHTFIVGDKSHPQTQEI
eukprot:Gb_40380 [translate_table: standard]